MEDNFLVVVLSSIAVQALSETDLAYLNRAIDLAEQGKGATSPNPMVGAVLVKDETVIGEGFHARYGEAHAEINALNAATVDPAGATLYVSLEPCCHEGQTPPCTDAIIAAGVRRVVIASDDPSEKANGRGLGVLRDEGIEVELATGEIADRANALNQPFRKHARTGQPYVVFKAAMSLDGKVATRVGDSKWISSEQSRELVHRWRAEFDAVAVGIGTALADDPELTARIEGIDRQPQRVIFDSEARLPPTSTLIQTAQTVPTTIVISRSAPHGAADGLGAAGANIIVATGENEPARVLSALTALGEANVTSILLEGGPHLAGAFLNADAIDELRLFVAPLIFADSRARDAFEGEGIETVAEAIRTLDLRAQPVGADVLLTAKLHEW